MSSSYRDTGRSAPASRRGSARRDPSVFDGLLGGQSRADKEAAADAFHKLLLFGALAVIAGVAGVRWLFLAVGLRFGWWSAPAFAPLLLWLLASGAMRHAVRPLKLTTLRLGARLILTPLIAVAVWLVWPLWADPVARAWHRAHGGWRPLAHGGLHYPLSTVLAAAPVALGIVAFLLLALAMTATPSGRAQHDEAEAPPPEDLPAPDWQRPAPRPGQAKDAR